VSGSLVDWGLAERVALGVAREADAPPQFGRAAVAEACVDARELVIAYTGLAPAGELPAGESVNRAEWSRAGLRTLREVAGELERGLPAGLALPGPLGGVARALLAAAGGTEAGIAVGYAARRVLGQYDLALVGPERPPRLLFVAPNLAAAHEELGEPAELFLRWIAIHETTHAVQFSSVPWLREHLGASLRELLDGTATELDLAWLREVATRLVRSDPRSTLRAVLRGDLPRLLAGPERAPILDRLQAAMAVIEGYAEHVMDAVVADADPGYARLRERLEKRRQGQGGLAAVIARLLGMELKLRQYTQGKRFCDAVVAEGGIGALNEVWRTPEALPTLAELDSPGEWLARVRAASATAA
jgi:coenzyme F420 biosynthesis associated uncharacterized protein